MSIFMSVPYCLDYCSFVASFEIWKCEFPVLPFLFFKDFIYLFLEMGREGEREGEKYQCVVASCVPRLGIEPATLWFTVQHSIHWATAARAVLLWDCFGYLESLEFSYEFYDQFVNFCKQGNWNFDGECTESEDHFGEYCHLNNIKSCGLWTWMSFHLFKSFISFSSVL